MELLLRLTTLQDVSRTPKKTFQVPRDHEYIKQKIIPTLSLIGKQISSIRHYEKRPL